MKTLAVVLFALLNLMGCMLSIIMFVETLLEEGDLGYAMAWMAMVIVSGFLAGICIENILSSADNEA
jgi:hypothetical protein